METAQSVIKNTRRPNKKCTTFSLIILLLGIFFTLGLPYRSTFFYVFWVSGIILLAGYFLVCIYRLSVRKALVYSFFAINAWLFANIALSKFAYDTARHYDVAILSLFYSLIAIVITDVFINLSRDSKAVVAFYVNLLWIASNLIYYILQNSGSVDELFSFSGWFVNRNEFAMTTTLLLGLLLYFYSSPSNNKKIKNILIIISCALVIATASVKGAIGLLILLYYFYVHGNFDRKRKMLFIFLIIIVVILGVSMELRVFDRISRYFSLFSEPESMGWESSTERLFYLVEGLKISRDHFFTGVGIDNSRFFLILPHKSVGTYSHINYIEMLINGGILVFLLYYIPIIFVAIKLILIKRKSMIIKFATCMAMLKLFWDIGSVDYYFIPAICAHSFILYVYFMRKYRIPQAERAE